MVRRSAFTLIELIFAIVIIAISVMSLPRMIQTNSDGIEGNLVQEAIFAASTQLNQAVAANWDKRSLEDTNTSFARVVDDGSCENNSSNSRYRLKVGHITEPYHRRCLDSNTTGSLGATTGSEYALEDYNGTKTLENAAVSQSGYKYIYSTVVTVTQNVIFGVNQINANPDLKMIEANISKVDNGTNTLITSLKTYSANIGEVDYYKRTY